jgi:hypothetical protein
VLHGEQHGPQPEQVQLYPHVFRLDALVEALAAVTADVERRFMFLEEEPPKPIAFEEFEAHLAEDKEPADPWVSRFLEVDQFMRRLTHLDTPLDANELYARYKGWLPFAHRLYTFVQGVSEDLAYEEELYYKQMKI